MEKLKHVGFPAHIYKRELLFSLSKSKGDFIVQPFKGSGKGGQKRNKTMSCCRITHPASGAAAECQDERSFEQNKRKAFRRLLEKPEFRIWHKIECARHLGRIASADEYVRREIKNIKVEAVVDGEWADITDKAGEGAGISEQQGGGGHQPPVTTVR